MSVKRLLYTILLYLVFPLVILRLLWRSRESPAYRQRFFERLGFVRRDCELPIIWVHAVSVGETIAAKPLIESLLTQYPNHRLLLTCTTPTGSEQVRRLFADRVLHFYFPYDLPEILFRFLKRIEPQIVIIIETEIWPNLYAACYKRNIPIIIANARLSPRSTQSYLKIKSLVANTLAKASLIAVRSAADRDNFILLGADKDKTIVAGNIKFDLKKDERQVKAGRQRRLEWGGERQVWVAASTHKGEDKKILKIHNDLLKVFPQLLLIIVPRHPERFDEVYQLCCDDEHLITKRHSKMKSYQNTENLNIIVGDSMGEMQSWFAAADVVFMGGSLVETGGHNPLEATIQGVPVVSGEYMFNFEDISTELINNELLFTCKTLEQLERKVTELLKSNNDYFEQKADEVMTQHRGVTARLSESISALL